MTQRWRRKAVELEAVRQNATDPNGNQVQGWRVWHPELFWSVWVTLHEFEREYEPVPSEPHDFDPMAGCCNPRLFMEVNGDLLRWRESLKLADELADAHQDLLDTARQYANYLWGVGDRCGVKEMEADIDRKQTALSAYLESRKGKD